MRTKVTGIGNEIKKMMKERNISIEELSREANISVRLLKSFVNLEKEPYIIPEMDNIVKAFGLSREEKLDLFEKWQILNKNNL
ncbi:MAG: hypothetical protein E7313_07250 [Clostridiales bacterium]|nr:hypothetical protein [Clostridiales bacterium]